MHCNISFVIDFFLFQIQAFKFIGINSKYLSYTLKYILSSSNDYIIRHISETLNI